MTIEGRPPGTTIWVYKGNTFTATLTFPSGYLTSKTMLARLVEDDGTVDAVTSSVAGDVLTVTLTAGQTTTVTASTGRLQIVDNTAGANQTLISNTVVGSARSSTPTSGSFTITVDDGTITFPVTVAGIGPQGIPGPPGPGVPTGGTTGQALVKTSNADDATGWHTMTASDVGADASGAASSAVSAHVAATDPHGDRAYTDAQVAGKATTAALTTETNRATAAEAANATAIANEATTRASADTANAAAITAEATTARTNEGLAAQKANNLSDLASASTARNNLGLGSAATHPSTDFDAAGAAATVQTNLTTEAATARAAEGLAAQKANNLSDLASASTARTNLGLGSAATQPSSAFDTSGAAATVQSNLTAEAATARAAEAALMTRVTAVSVKTTSQTVAVASLTPFDATSGALTATLPSGTAVGDVVVVEKNDTSANAVTISGSIRGSASTISLPLVKESAGLVWTGSTWWPVWSHKTLGSLDARYDAAGAATAAVATEATTRAAADALLTPLTDSRLSDNRAPIDASVTAAKMAQDVIGCHPVRLVSTSNVGTLSGSQTLDGSATATGDDVLLTGQTTASQNGPYVANNSGAWSRPTYWATGATVSKPHLWAVATGSTRSKRLYVSTTFPAAVDTTSVTIADVTAQSIGSGIVAAQNMVTGLGLNHVARLVSTSNIASLSGGATIDGVAAATNDLALLVGQTTASQNGLWKVNTGGAWTRPTDWVAAGSMTGAHLVTVTAGTLFAGSQWSTTNTASWTVDTTSVTFAQPGSNNLPWLIDIDPFPTAISQVNWDTINLSTTLLYGAYKISTGAQNAEINFDVVLSAGTWTLEMICQVGTNQGIAAITVGGSTPTSLGGSADSIDQYAAAGAANQRKTITGMVIPATAKYRLRLLMSTKNASSSSFFGIIQHLQFRRTA